MVPRFGHVAVRAGVGVLLLLVALVGCIPHGLALHHLFGHHLVGHHLIGHHHGEKLTLDEHDSGRTVTVDGFSVVKIELHGPGWVVSSVQQDHHSLEQVGSPDVAHRGAADQTTTVTYVAVQHGDAVVVANRGTCDGQADCGDFAGTYRVTVDVR